MEVNSPNSQPLSAEELKHLEHLKTVVKQALENGVFSTDQIAHIKSIIFSNGKVTYEELRTIHETIKEVMGDTMPEMEWRPNT